MYLTPMLLHCYCWCYYPFLFYNVLLVETDVTRLRSLTKPQLLSFYNHYIDPRSTNQRKVSVHLYSQDIPLPSPETSYTPSFYPAVLEKLATCLAPFDVDI